MGDIAASTGRLQPYARVNLYRTSSGHDSSRFVYPAASARSRTGAASATPTTSAAASGNGPASRRGSFASRGGPCKPG